MVATRGWLREVACDARLLREVACDARARLRVANTVSYGQGENSGPVPPERKFRETLSLWAYRRHKTAIDVCGTD